MGLQPGPPAVVLPPPWDGGAADNRELTWISTFKTARAPLGVVVLAAIGLGLPPQIADMLAGFDDKGEPLWPLLLLHFALAWLALSAWYWARAALYARFEIDESDGRTRGALIAVKLAGASQQTIQRARHAFDLTPRWLFWAVALLGAIVTARAGAWGQFVIVVVWSVVGWLIIRIRVQQFGNHTAGILPSDLRAATTLCGAFCAVLPRLRALVRYAPFPDRVAWAFLGVAMLLFLAGSIETMALWPDGGRGLAGWIAFIFRGPAAALICMAFAIGPWTALCFIVDGIRLKLPAWLPLVGGWTLPRPPAFTLLVLVVSVVPIFLNLHTVRIAEPKPALTNPNQRDSLRNCSRPGWKRVRRTKPRYVR